MLRNRTFHLIAALACAACALGDAGNAAAGEPSGVVTTIGSAYMSDQFSATGPAGTLWQPLLTRRPIGRFRYEISMFREIGHEMLPSTRDRSFESLGIADGGSWGGATLSLSYVVPHTGAWDTMLAARAHRSTSYQKTQLGVADYHSLLLQLDRKEGRVAIETEFGYKLRTPLPGYQIRNGFYGYAGGSYDIGQGTRAELFVDWRQSPATTQSGYAAEVSARLSRSIAKHTKVEAYATRGVTNGNRDSVAGLFLALDF